MKREDRQQGLLYQDFIQTVGTGTVHVQVSLIFGVPSGVRGGGGAGVRLGLRSLLDKAEREAEKAKERADAGVETEGDKCAPQQPKTLPIPSPSSTLLCLPSLFLLRFSSATVTAMAAAVPMRTMLTHPALSRRRHVRRGKQEREAEQLDPNTPALRRGPRTAADDQATYSRIGARLVRGENPLPVDPNPLELV